MTLWPIRKLRRRFTYYTRKTAKIHAVMLKPSGSNHDKRALSLCGGTFYIGQDGDVVPDDEVVTCKSCLRSMTNRE